MSRMKRIITTALYLAVIAAMAGCAKHEASGPNEANERYFDAWMKVNYPDAKPAGLGIYILEEKKSASEGTSVEVGDKGYAFIEQKVSALSGTISSYTDKETAKQLGEYDTTSYYGPKFYTTTKGTNPAGFLDGLIGMKTGEYRKYIVPSWLMNYAIYNSEADYLDPDDEDYKASNYESTIYEVTVKDYTEDINKWQKEKIGQYFAENSDIFGKMTANDTIKGYGGVYYKQLKAPADTASFKTDTTLYINYTGRLLNGLVFDTTIERVAKDNGLYSADRTYEPVTIKWGEKFNEITLSGSSVVNGFALTLWQMRSMEKGIGVFTSDYGYGGTGSGASIPGFAPLIFEIEFVPKPE